MSGMILYTTDVSALPRIKQDCRQMGYRELLLQWRNEKKEARFLWVQDMTRAAAARCAKRNNCRVLLYDAQGYAQIDPGSPEALILTGEPHTSSLYTSMRHIAPRAPRERFWSARPCCVLQGKKVLSSHWSCMQ